MFADMPPMPPVETLQLRFVCPAVAKYKGVLYPKMPSSQAYDFGRLDGGYTVEVVRRGNKLIYTITRACAST